MKRVAVARYLLEGSETGLLEPDGWRQRLSQERDSRWYSLPPLKEKRLGEAVGLHLGGSLSSVAKQSMCLQSLHFLRGSRGRADGRRLKNCNQEEPCLFTLLRNRQNGSENLRQKIIGGNGGTYAGKGTNDLLREIKRWMGIRL